MDFYNKANLTDNIGSAAEIARAAVPASGPACLHAYVDCGIKKKFKQIAAEYGMTYNQLPACIIDEHE